MKNEINEELEEFIKDWYCDKKSYKFAKELGLFLFQFIDNIKQKGLTNETISRHTGNCWDIGYLECNYGFHKKFTPEIFACKEADHLYEFERKFSDSKYAIGSYKSTWRKLSLYATQEYKMKEDI